MSFPRQEYQSGLPFPVPGNLPSSGIALSSLAFAGGFFTTQPPERPLGSLVALQKVRSNLRLLFGLILKNFLLSTIKDCSGIVAGMDSGWCGAKREKWRE